MSHSQRALITIIDEGTSAIKKAQSQMDAGTKLPQLGDDAVSHYVIKKLQLYQWYIKHITPGDLVGQVYWHNR